eukprot:jgi/Mesvir1/13168/Mv06132-RA.1
MPRVPHCASVSERTVVTESPTCASNVAGLVSCEVLGVGADGNVECKGFAMDPRFYDVQNDGETYCSEAEASVDLSEGRMPRHQNGAFSPAAPRKKLLVIAKIVKQLGREIIHAGKGGAKILATGLNVTWLSCLLLAAVHLVMSVQWNTYDNLTDGYEECGQDSQACIIGPAQLLQSLRRASSTNPFPTEFLLPWGARNGDRILRGQWWRWVTSIFVHSSTSHLLGNLVPFAALAAVAEHRHGPGVTFLVILASGWAGNLAGVLLECLCCTVVGASGAVTGLAGFSVVNVVYKSHSWERANAHRAAPFITSTLCGVLILQLMGAFRGTGFASKAPVSYWSHGGGLLAGTIVGVACLRPHRRKPICVKLDSKHPLRVGFLRWPVDVTDAPRLRRQHPQPPCMNARLTLWTSTWSLYRQSLHGHSGLCGIGSMPSQYST